MQITIKYTDNTSFTPEEVVRLAQHNYGKSVNVRIEPDSTNPHDMIYFAIQQIITGKQMELLYDNKYTYQEDIRKLRAEVIADIKELLDSVIIDNEARVL